MNIPVMIKEVLNRITQEGYEAYLVGGAVRDYVFEVESKDYDICTNMPLEKVKELFPKFAIMKPNNNRQTGIMRIDGKDIEISEFKGKDLLEDLSNRDFTINAIAMDQNGNIIDPYNGIESLQKGELSLIKKDGEAFKNDSLRILRAVRIAARMNFSIDENCKAKMNESKELLKNIPAERIYRELIQLLVTDNPAYYIRESKDVFFQIIPELKPMDKFEQHNKWHLYDVFEHTLKVLENTPKNIYLRLAALFHDIGKPEKFFTDDEGIGHFYGHPEASAKIFDEISVRLKMDNKTKKVVRLLIEKHDMTMSKKSDKIYAFIKEYGIDFIPLLFALKRADNKGQNPELANPVLEELSNTEQLYQEHILRFNNLQINGQKLLEMGFKSKKIKLVLEDIRKMVVTQRIENDEKTITEYINKRFKV